MTKEEVKSEEHKTEEQDSDTPKTEDQKPKDKPSWKKIGIGLGVVVIGNLYSYLTAYSKGIFFDANTAIGLLAIIIGLYIILK